MSIRGLARRSTPVGYATPTNAPVYVDSDDNKLKYIPAGSGTTEVEVVDASATQTLTNKTFTSPTVTTPVLRVNYAALTGASTNAAGATDITTSPMAFLSVTGASDSGFQLPTPAGAGAIYVIRKLTTDTLNVYPNGTTETIGATTSDTAVPIGAIGSLFISVSATGWLHMSIAS